MQNYFVKVSHYHPYPIIQEFRTSGSNFAAGIGKALRLWRKEVKGQKIKEISIKAIKL